MGFLDHVNKSSKEFWGKGCLLGNLGLELADTNPKIRAEVSKIFQRLTNRLEEIFEPAMSKTTSKKKASAKDLAEQFLVMLEGAIMLARVNRDWSIVNRAILNFKNNL